MKTKILELIDEKLKDKCNNPQYFGDEDGQARNNLLEELRKEIEAIEEWIPVTERLPEQFNPVAVVYNNKPDEIYINYYSKEMGEWRWLEYDDEKTWITHWKPLPLPPNTSSHD